MTIVAGIVIGLTGSYFKDAYKLSTFRGFLVTMSLVAVVWFTAVFINYLWS